MADFSLKSQAALNGFRRDFEGFSLHELTDLALLSIAIPLGRKASLTSVMNAHFGVSIPDIGTSSRSGRENTRVLGLQTDQFFLLFNSASNDPVAVVKDQLGDTGYCTDQSDSWATLRMAGLESRRALGRMCMIDLDQSVFAIHAVARTRIEHLAVIIVRESADSFLLFTPRSSALSFLHALESGV